MGEMLKSLEGLSALKNSQEHTEVLGMWQRLEEYCSKRGIPKRHVNVGICGHQSYVDSKRLPTSKLPDNVNIPDIHACCLRKLNFLQDGGDIVKFRKKAAYSHKGTSDRAIPVDKAAAIVLEYAMAIITKASQAKVMEDREMTADEMATVSLAKALLRAFPQLDS